MNMKLQREEGKIYVNTFTGIPEPRRIPMDKKKSKSTSIKKVYEYVLSNNIDSLYNNTANQSSTNHMNLQDKQVISSVMIWEDSNQIKNGSFMIHELFSPRLH